VLILAAASAVLAIFANSRFGMAGVQSVLLAFGVCCVAGVSAYAIAVYTVGTPNAMPGMMGGMLFRTVLPIVAGMVGSNSSQQLHAVGFMGHCMLLFLVGLISEVILNVRLIQSADRRRSAAQSSSAGNHIASVL
jgi:hypothetical protein